MKLVLLVSPLCEIALKAAVVARKVAKELNIEFEEVSVTEERGEKLALRLGVTLLPSYIVNGKLLHQGFLEEERLRDMLVSQGEKLES
ncbi:MAG TPA: hypothetical protein ENG61_01670 [Candidatus Korarchaeota archaeon]|nr:MAG: hypothetical protein DRO05_06425 [Candidatus Korarchaeota archaeon]HDD69049.1 hypothetical protein [Candidatus Korarchaeota archaeon]